MTWREHGLSARRPTRLALAAVILALMALVAFGGNIAKAGSKSPVVIGVIQTQTGSLAVFGQEILPALQLAVKQINAAGGVLGGRPLQIVSADDLGTTSGAVAALQQVLAAHPVAIVGEVLTPLVPPMFPLLAQAKIPLVGGGIAETVGANEPGGSPWYFKIAVDTNTVTAAEFAYAEKHYNLSRVGIAGSADQTGQSLTAGIDALLKQAKKPAPVAVEYNCTTCTDYTAQIEALKAANVTAVFFGANEPEDAGFLTGTQQLGLTAPVAQNESAGYATFFDKLVSPTIMDNGDIAVADSVNDPKNPADVAFATAYEKITGKPPTEIVPEWYAGMFMMAAAINAAGSTNGAKIDAALAKTNNLTAYKSIKMPGVALSCLGSIHHFCNHLVYVITGKNGQETVALKYNGGKHL
jgi:branched-chain amino acid transport system substrate-binding protein